MNAGNFNHIWNALSLCLHYEPDYRIECPLMLAHGEHDNLGNFKKVMPRWVWRDPLARYVVIPQAGHVANQDNPKFFNQLLLDFLQLERARKVSAMQPGAAGCVDRFEQENNMEHEMISTSFEIPGYTRQNEPGAGTGRDRSLAQCDRQLSPVASRLSLAVISRSSRNCVRMPARKPMN